LDTRTLAAKNKQQEQTTRIGLEQYRQMLAQLKVKSIGTLKGSA
jgi:hypothetical protein